MVGFVPGEQLRSINYAQLQSLKSPDCDGRRAPLGTEPFILASGRIQLGSCPQSAVVTSANDRIMSLRYTDTAGCEKRPGETLELKPHIGAQRLSAQKRKQPAENSDRRNCLPRTMVHSLS